MGNQVKELYEFGRFRLDPARRILLCDNQPVPLQLKAFETLLVLVRNSGQVVLKDELMEAVWPDTFVEESNLAQIVYVLRKTLGPPSGDRRYIVTIPGRGYSFSAPVDVISQQETVVVESRSLTRVVIHEEHEERDADEDRFPELSQSASPALTTGPVIAPRARRWKLLLGAALLALPVAFLFRPTLPLPKIVDVRQITHLGSLVHNARLLVDSGQIYFRVWDGNSRVIRSVSPEGGEIFPVDLAFPQMDIDDISPSGSEFLVINLADPSGGSTAAAAPRSVWRVPVPAGSPRPVGDLRVNEIRWSPDGQTVAYSIASDLYLANSDGTSSRKLATFSDRPTYLAWSPNGKRLRFSVADLTSNGVALWQIDLPTGQPQRLFPDWPASWRALPGGWTPDGRYFFFSVLADGTRNIWAIREHGELFERGGLQPVQLTTGPLTFYLPLPGKDNKSVFVVGEQLRGQLLRYDSSARQFVPYAKGISADQVAYSRDGQWMAYIEYNEGILVRSRLDGTERRQLTFPPMRAFNPQWSPDGTQITFQGLARVGTENKIYRVSRSGGVPALALASNATPENHDRQTYPSWSADGASILFSNADQSASNQTLLMLDLKSNHVATLPGSAGLHWGQLSPDGQSVAALNDASQLVLYNMASHQTRVVAELADYPRWSADGQFLYFGTVYFSTRGSAGGVYRLNNSTNATELVVKYPDFLLAGAYGVNYGLTPDDDILLLRDLSIRDLYALDLDLP
jgi:DNA-binding winged helix-turn-helix (wHTH) protein/Tol biopolymer transport system component